MHIVVVSPHPDDAEYGAGGILAGAHETDTAATTIACFDSPLESGDAGIVAEARRSEAERAAALLGASMLCLHGHTDVPGGATGLQELVQLFRTVKPDLIVTVDPNDRHPFHRQVTAWVEDAAFISANPQMQMGENLADPLLHPPQLAYMEAFSTNEFHPNVYVNVTPWFTTARKALLAHTTGIQICPGLEYQMRVTHMRHGISAGVPFAEGFRLAQGYTQDWVGPRTAILAALVNINRQAGSTA